MNAFDIHLDDEFSDEALDALADLLLDHLANEANERENHPVSPASRGSAPRAERPADEVPQGGAA